MMGIDKINNTLAGQIAQKLDAADGKKDGKISASVWNDFVKDKGGKQIKNFISVESAMQSINTYATRNANKSQEGQKSNDIKKKWLAEFGDVNTSNGNSTKVTKNISQNGTIQQKNTNPPQKDANPPQKEAPATGVCKPQYANQTIKNEDTGKSEEYDKKGNLIAEYDEKGNVTKQVFRYADGAVNVYSENEYDGNNVTKKVVRNADGSVMYYSEYEYDEKGNVTKQVDRNPKGSVDVYYEYEYDENGNLSKQVSKTPNGTVDSYFEYDDKGNITKEKHRNSV
jgi:hypothetical protein